MDGLNDLIGPSKKVHDENWGKPTTQVKAFWSYKTDIIQIMDPQFCQWGKEVLGPVPMWVSMV